MFAAHTHRYRLLGMADTEALLDVGPANESKEEHMNRHDGGDNGCARCRFYAFGAGWMRAYGSVQDPRTSQRTMVVWVQERPPRFGGQWGIGCAFCAHHLRNAKTNAQPPGRERKSQAPPRHRSNGSLVTGRAQASPRLLAKWARHDVRCAYLQSEHIRKHAFSQAHKLATERFFAPETPLVVLLQKTVEDEKLLEGAVPQLEDWLRVWRVCKKPQSWQAAEDTLSTERYISRLRASDANRRALQDMALIEREVVREAKRDCIRSSRFISYVFDERDGRMVLRYRCDVPVFKACDPWASAGASQAGAKSPSAWGRTNVENIDEKEAMKLCHSKGVIGAGRMHHAKNLQEMTDEGALQLTQDVISMIEAFCTPLGDSCDVHLADSMKRKATSIAVDGAALKAARLLRERHMPNAIIIFRDASHAIRIACKEPLVRTGGFKEQYHELFKKKGALLKKIDHSNKLKAELEICQKYIVATDGCQGGGLKTIMLNLSHAPQRWESMSAPYRIYCCIFKAIATLLAVVYETTKDWQHNHKP